jgi:hypothetical protein
LDGSADDEGLVDGVGDGTANGTEDGVAGGVTVGCTLGFAVDISDGTREVGANVDPGAPPLKG